jgi:hypothetical protein
VLGGAGQQVGVFGAAEHRALGPRGRLTGVAIGYFEQRRQILDVAHALKIQRRGGRRGSRARVGWGRPKLRQNQVLKSVTKALSRPVNGNQKDPGVATRTKTTPGIVI